MIVVSAQIDSKETRPPGLPRHLPVAAPRVDSRVRCGFLFNHDQLHQIAHSLPIALELMRSSRAVQVSLLATSAQQFVYLERLLTQRGLPRENLRLIRLPAALRAIATTLDPLVPFSRIAALLANREQFRRLDVLVTPEKTSLLLRSLAGLKSLKFIHTRHGAGDRGVGFDRHSGEYDLVLMSGEKIRDRLQSAGVLKAGGYAIVGYPKFDLCALRPNGLKLFDNDLPTVLYNPHCSPRLSSWYRYGLDVIEAFDRTQRYNLVVAPHVMLFRKRLQISLNPVRLKLPGRIPARYYLNNRILIDPGSDRSTDMTYTEAADCYLGDVSSQVYEFLRRPRPCIFLDAHRTDWRHDPNFHHWNAGPVLVEIDGIIPAIDTAFATHGEYVQAQRSLFAYSIDMRDTPSSKRAAEAILNFVQQTFPRRSGLKFDMKGIDAPALRDE